MSWLIFALFLALRLPLIFHGYGVDPDAWRIANTAWWLVDGGVYHASRLPGYPFFEFCNALLISGNWLATNGATLLVSWLALLAFSRLLKIFVPRQSLPILLVVVVAPIFVRQSGTTMDYMWALCAILWSIVHLRNNRPVLAGILLGIATGCRITSMAFIVPLMYMCWQDRQPQHILRFIGASVITAMIVWIPVLSTYGMQFLQYTPARYGALDIAARLAQDVFGLPGMIGFAGLLATIGLVGLLPSDNARIRRVSSDDIFLLLGAGAGFAPFFLVPEDPAYCIPGITVGLLLLGRWSTRPILIWVFAGLCFVTSAIGEIRVRRGWGVEVRQGAVYHEVLAKRRQMDAAQQLLDFQPLFPEKPTWIIAGYLRPVLGVLDAGLRTLDADAVAVRNGVTYVYLMKKEELQNVVAAGFFVFIQPEAVAYTKHLYNFDPTHYGAQMLPSTFTE